MTDDEKIKLDYGSTMQYFLHLADVRFRLLALLPIASGTALAIVPEHFGARDTLALGVLGLVTTTGILLYDQRNSQIYNCLVGRANLLEESLRMPAMRDNKQVGGAFLDRPGKAQLRRIVGVIPANHGLGLSLIYSASVGAWLYVIARACLGLFGQKLAALELFVSLAPAFLGILLFLHLNHVDRCSRWEGSLPEDVRQRIDK